MGNQTMKEMAGCFLRMVPVFLLGLVLASAPAHAGDKGDSRRKASWKADKRTVQLGPRPTRYGTKPTQTEAGGMF